MEFVSPLSSGMLLFLKKHVLGLSALLIDEFEQKLLQKVIVEVLPEWCMTDDERLVVSMKWLDSKAEEDL
ncbi:hypothetical protein Bca4012_087538 [Brassica carinata]|uniref:Uncharacterized protein n=3 Tax=Brassica TaxID=3705 RepID=A0A0D3A4P5_BRAOL|nr:hypothetical protein F2Q68_00029595 [Brassica cretica]KAF3530442.1 hypothetical protein DY000_02037599 [Brassica cretica]